MNNLAPMKNCPGGGGVQGNLNWMPGYKLGDHFQHVIRCFLLHYAVFCLANVNINTLPAYFYGICEVSCSKESMF